MFHPRIIAGSIVLLALPACAGDVLPQQQLMDTQGKITSAEELRGDEDPDAKLHLQFARDQVRAAKRMMDDGDEEEAKRMLDRATADADLALLLARTEKLREESRAAQSEVDDLRSDATATAPTPSKPTRVGTIE